MMKPIQLELKSITQVRHIRHIPRLNAANEFEQSEFYINLTDGSKIRIDYHVTGIDPIQVFEALDVKGIQFIEQE